jgi:2-methylcitrate dehydratase PrpD
VAAGRLLGLRAPELRRALGIACSMAAGSRMNFGTDTKPLHAGLAAQSGVQAAALAARGVTAREDALECDMGLADLHHGARPLALPAPGRPFALEDPGVELKPYPSCRFTHRLIDAVLALRARHPGETAVRFECAVLPLAQKILIWPEPASGLQAKFSAPYCTAVAWLDGRPDLASFSDARATRPDVQDLLRRVRVVDAAGPEESVRVEFASGAQDCARVRFAPGSPERPLTERERMQKLRDCAAPALGEDGTRALAAALAKLESLPDVRALTRLLSADGASS